jgi:hypothetical protein
VTESIPLAKLLKPTASDLADLFRFGDRICRHCVACYVEPRLLTGSLFACAGYAAKPTVSTQPERPRWCDLLRTIERGTECVAVMTSNTKRRLWPQAVASRYATRWQPLFVHEHTERLLRIDVSALLECLELVTSLHSAGYSKTVIATSLLHSLSSAQDYAELLAAERALARWRMTDEFLVALYVAQKEEV